MIVSSDQTRREHIVRTTIPYTAQPNGLPTSPELTRIHKLEESLVNMLEPLCLHVGHTLAAGRLTVYLYSPEARNETLNVKTGLLSSTTVEIRSSLDPTWSAYEE